MCFAFFFFQRLRKKTESKLNRIVDGLMFIALFNMFFYLWPNANQEIYHVQLFRTHKHKIPMDFLLNARFGVFFPLSLSLETIESPQYSMNLKFVWVFEFVLNPLLLFFSYLFLYFAIRYCSAHSQYNTRTLYSSFACQQRNSNV